MNFGRRLELLPPSALANRSLEHVRRSLQQLSRGRVVSVELEKAKHLMFGDAAVQFDTAKRRTVLRDLAAPSSLSDLDRESCEEPDRLSERLTTFAKDRCLLELH